MGLLITTTDRRNRRWPHLAENPSACQQSATTMYKSKSKPARTVATAIAMLLASFSASADVDPQARREDGSTALQWAAFQDDVEQAARPDTADVGGGPTPSSHGRTAGRSRR